jgi:hypothetical protein
MSSNAERVMMNKKATRFFPGKPRLKSRLIGLSVARSWAVIGGMTNDRTRIIKGFSLHAKGFVHVLDPAHATKSTVHIMEFLCVTGRSGVK